MPNEYLSIFIFNLENIKTVHFRLCVNSLSRTIILNIVHSRRAVVIPPWIPNILQVKVNKCLQMDGITVTIIHLIVFLSQAAQTFRQIGQKFDDLNFMEQHHLTQSNFYPYYYCTTY